MRQAALSLHGVRLVRDDRAILADIDWTVEPGQRWIVLGQNGSGKTSLCQTVTMYVHPTAGTVQVLGQTLGRTDVRALRARIGYTSAALVAMLRPTLTSLQVVVTAKHADLAPWWHSYSDDDYLKARRLLARFGCQSLADRSVGTLASGERQRVLLARTLMADPELLILDEPTAGLDLGGREQLVRALAALAGDPQTPPILLITHHVDEIPPGFTHVLMLAAGRPLASGPLESTLTADRLSACFGLALQVERREGRWLAWAR